LKIKKLNKKAIVPKQGTNGSAGYDIHVCIDNEVTIQPNECVMLGTGFSLWVEDVNVCAVCLPRSGLGAKKGIILGNTVGLIDSDYQGEWHIPVWNRSKEPVTIYPNDKICQCIFIPIVHPSFKEVVEFEEETKRCENGFGSTGVHYN
jgi:dUTP pyrophosphatase